MVDRFEELRTYIAIVETGGVNAAAAKLEIARSAASRRLSELEARVGATLVQRSTRRFELTATGQRYYQDAKRILDELSRIDAYAGSVATVRDTIVIDVPPHLVPAVATTFADLLSAKPGTALRLVHGSKRDKPALVVSTSKDLGGRLIGHLRTVIACSPSYLAHRPMPEDLGDLSGHIAIAVDGSDGGWISRSGAKVAPAVAISVGDDAAAVALAVAGAGLARAPYDLCVPALRAGMLVEVLAAYAEQPQPIYAHSIDGSPAAAALIDHMAERLEQA